MTTHTCTSRDKIDNVEEGLRDMRSNLLRIEQLLLSNNSILAVNTESLRQHMKRTDILEKKVEQQQRFMNIALGIWVCVQVLLPFIMKGV
jgi:hypothetical protein